MPAPAGSANPKPQPTDRRAERARGLAIDLARLAANMRCSEVVILDLRQLSPVCDYFVIATGTSDRQMQAVADAIDQHAAAIGHQRYGLAGYEQANWILIDYVDVVVHLFDPAHRSYYDLELLWGDAPRLDWA